MECPARPSLRPNAAATAIRKEPLRGPRILAQRADEQVCPQFSGGPRNGRHRMLEDRFVPRQPLIPS
eukprot:11200478-Lingulodinium_polyedra.AAC.1